MSSPLHSLSYFPTRRPLAVAHLCLIVQCTHTHTAERAVEAMVSPRSQFTEHDTLTSEPTMTPS